MYLHLEDCEQTFPRRAVRLQIWNRVCGYPATVIASIDRYNKFQFVSFKTAEYYMWVAWVCLRACVYPCACVLPLCTDRPYRERVEWFLLGEYSVPVGTALYRGWVQSGDVKVNVANHFQGFSLWIGDWKQIPSWKHQSLVDTDTPALVQK